MPGIFISYRRKDTGGHAGHLAADLISRFGRSSVFMDVDSIPGGMDFEERIRHALDSCQVALVLIGENWLSEAGRRQKRRIDEESDWVRKEVAAALRRTDVTVVPILVEGTAMPAPGELPAEISSLTKIQACELSNRQWTYDFNRLSGTVERVASQGKLKRFLRELRLSLHRPRSRSRRGGAILGLGVLAAVIVLLATGGDKQGSGCQNLFIPQDVRRKLSDAAGTSEPAVKGSVYYGSCKSQAWALARFPDGSDGVFKQTGFGWRELGSIASAKCSVPRDLLSIWKQDGC